MLVPMTHRKLAMILAICAGVTLLAMQALSLATGAAQEPHEHYALAESYALDLLAHAPGLRALFALDIAFCILYTGFFAALAAYLRALGRPFVALALGAMIGTCVLDFIEDHHIVMMLNAAEHKVLPSQAEIGFQEVESALKFSLSYLSLVLFGLAIPRDQKLGAVLAWLLIAGSLLNAIIGYALPLSAQRSFDGGRYIGFLVAFAVSIAWLRRAPEPVPATPSA